MRLPPLSRRIPLAVMLAASASAFAVAQSSEELARRQYANGVDLLRERKYTEALRDFQAVVDAYPTSSVADNALLEMARYHMDVTRDYDQAQAAIDILIKKYPTSDAAPYGYLLDGQVALIRGRQPADVDRALSSFQRVPRMFPESPAVAPALLARADVLRQTGKCPEATAQYSTLTLSYPRSRWSANASIGASRCLVSRGRPVDAMALLQEAVSNAGADDDQAGQARDLNTILYRLYLRPPQPPFAFAEKAVAGPARLRDVNALMLRGNRLVGVSDNTVGAYDLASDGRVIRSDRVEGVRGAFTTPDGRTGYYSSKGVQMEGGTLEPLSVVKPDKTRRVLEDIIAVTALSTGELLVAESNGPIVHRFGRDLKVLPGSIQTRADRLAVGSVDQIASLDRSEKGVGLWTPEGRQAGRIPPKGADWRFDEPVDITFDTFDHLYVLDRGAGTVWVFQLAPAPKLLISFSIPERAPGAFRRASAFALDGSGRLYIHDDRAERVQVYQ